MLKTVSLLICLFSITISLSQQKAITETGDEVILNEDGTWKYLNEDSIEKTEIPINPIKFEKDKTSTFLFKSNKFNVGFWINPKLWSFKKATDNPEAEYEFHLKGGDLYGMVISEKVEIPLETMRTVALENGKQAAPDLKIVQEEYRIVNGLKVLFLQMDGSLQGIKFSYYGYYYSSENGTVQLITYTSQNLLESYKKDCKILLNGLVEVQKTN